MRLTSLTNFFVDFRGGAERTYWDPKDAWKAIQMSWSWRWWWCWWLGGSSWWWWWFWWSSRPASPPQLSSWPGTFRLASPNRGMCSKFVEFVWPAHLCSPLLTDYQSVHFKRKHTFAAITQLADFPARVESSNLWAGNTCTWIYLSQIALKTYRSKSSGMIVETWRIMHCFTK